MITIIITACREPKTITKAILRVADNKLPNSEILVVAPDKETLNEANKIKTRVKNLRIIKDSGEGKPQALNLAVSKSKGGIIVFTDGDVFVGKNAIRCLISHFKNKKVGAVTGKPVSINPKENKYGYWAYLLTTIAHLRRKKAMLKGKRFFCSGYLFAIRKELFPQLPSELLSEDGYISHFVYTKGYEIAYEPRAVVYVKYPTNFNDWIKQKRRSAGGYNQIKDLTRVEIRSFKKELFGTIQFFPLIKNFKEFAWFIELIIARACLWAIIYKDINIKKKTRKELWQRVESTK